MINKEEFHFLREKLSNSNFRFAKSMPKTPHWYTLRKDWNDSEFVKTVLLIREYGNKERFWSKEYFYLYMNGYKYWTMGAPINYPNGLPCTILINKARIEYNTKYDKIALQYDDLFKNQEYKDEDKKIMDLIKPRGSVLDIGCGTGLFLEYHNPDKYLGIDISENMLKKIKLKYPNRQTIRTSFEDFYGKTFDTVIALYGTASYIKPEALDKIEYLLNPGGKVFLMFYKKGYYPETYVKTGINIDFYLSTKQYLKEFNNYMIWEYEYIQ